MAVFLASKEFQSEFRGRHNLVRWESMTVVAYINHQEGLWSHVLNKLAYRLLLWAQHNLRSVRVVHLLGSMNTEADMLSWNGPPHKK